MIKEIFPASLANNLPSNEQIAARAGDVIIGTFSEPPVGATGSKAIIDIHNDAVITIAPVDQLEGIVSAVNSLLVEQEYPNKSSWNLQMKIELKKRLGFHELIQESIRTNVNKMHACISYTPAQSFQVYIGCLEY